MGFLVWLIQKIFIFASVFKKFYVIFLSLFVNFLFVCDCVFFLSFFPPAFLLDSGDFPKKCTALERAFSPLSDRLLLPKIYTCLTLRKLSLILALQFNFRSLILLFLLYILSEASHYCLIAKSINLLF